VMWSNLVEESISQAAAFITCWSRRRRRWGIPASVELPFSRRLRANDVNSQWTMDLDTLDGQWIEAASAQRSLLTPPRRPSWEDSFELRHRAVDTWASSEVRLITEPLSSNHLAQWVECVTYWFAQIPAEPNWAEKCSLSRPKYAQWRFWSERPLTVATLKYGICYCVKESRGKKREYNKNENDHMITK